MNNKVEAMLGRKEAISRITSLLLKTQDGG